MGVCVAIIAAFGYSFHVVQNTGKVRLMSPLQWIHILILKLVLDQGGQMPFSIYAKSPVTVLVEEFLAKNAVPPIYGKPISHAQTLKRILETLTGMGLVTQTETGIALTDAGRSLAAQLSRDWKTWPRLLPFNDEGQPDFDNADFV